jgi:hypothetical protein
VRSGTPGDGVSAGKSVTGRAMSDTGGADAIGAWAIGEMAMGGGFGIGDSGSPRSPAGAPGK